ncbi:T-cell-interacting, activating receptor on myeloid cells protein 1-like [Myotis lucifugus]|uniref:T-cell-interacting, activating receptor on myeloid cells protein 1-like n=1 Tax=Myotis lucifugus TaxID=59463 RepID=UPI000CCBE1BD|nr:T-cell-interacting, activating receptor on myeloid cells protein 1-like [Myotis lucifugus]
MGRWMEKDRNRAEDLPSSRACRRDISFLESEQKEGFFPKPSLHARPGWKVTAGGNVTLQCEKPSHVTESHMFALLKKGTSTPIQLQSAVGMETDFSLPSVTGSDTGAYSCVYYQPRAPFWASEPSDHLMISVTEGLAEFHLSDVKLGDAGEYTCEYRTGSPTRRSPPSDVLLLLVTGNFPKPSLKAHQSGEMTAGENVTLQCQLPRHVTEPHMFALLKKGTSTPIKLQGPVGMDTDFYLLSVTGSDTGAYSCVYYQPKAAFLASEPSDHLSIWVTDSPGATSTDYTTGNLIRLGLSALITVLMVAFLVEAWWSQRRSPSGSSN